MEHDLTKPACFAFPLIPDEKVLWSGQPPSRAAVANVFRLPLLIMFLPLYALMIAFVFDMIPDKASRSSDASALEQTDGDVSAAADPAPANERHFSMVLLYALLSGMLVVWILIAIGISRSRRYLVTNQRICIQSGFLWRSQSIADLDKIVSVNINHSPVQRAFGLCSIELTLPGAIVIRNSSFQLPFTMFDIPADSEVIGLLLNTWLPRDNRVSA